MKAHLGIIFILLFAAVLRFWQLGSIPPGLHADEALTGYTAYSLLRTGKDLLGNQHVVAFADVNGGGTFPSLYSWLLVPVVAVFGLTTAVDRVPSAVFGVIAVYAFYRMVLVLLKRRDVALIGAGLLAINPGAIHISRQGLLESVALGLVLAGVAWFVSARDKPTRYVWAGIAWGFSLFSYDAPRLFLVFLLPALTVARWSHLKKYRGHVYACMTIVMVSYGLLFFQLAGRGEISEYTKSSLFNKVSVEKTVQIERDMTNAPALVSRVFHNKATVFFKRVLSNYTSLFTLNWFYINGYGNLQQSVSNYGQYHLYELPLAVIGWYLMFRKWAGVWWLMLVWIISGALPGGLSSSHNVYRNSMLIPAPIVASAVGLAYVLNLMRHIRSWMRTAAISVGLAVILFLSASYLVTYFYDYPVYASEAWSKQQNDAIRYGASRAGSYTYVFFDGGRPWALQYAFQTLSDPDSFRRAINAPVEAFGGSYIRFGNLYFGQLTDESRVLPSASVHYPPDSLVVTLGADNVFASDTPVMRFPAPDGYRATYKAVEVPKL